MKSVYLTFKNSAKNTFSNLSQLFGMIMLVTLLALIITLMTSISTRVLDEHNQLAKKSNQHNIVMQWDPFENALATYNNNHPDPNEKVNNNIEAQQLLVNDFQQILKNKEINFDYSRTEGRDFSQVFNQKNEQMTIKGLVKTTIDQSSGVDNLIISEGRGFNSSFDSIQNNPNGYHEVVLDSSFALNNKIKIGQLIRFQIDQFGTQFLVDAEQNSQSSDQFTQDFKNELKEIEKQGLTDPNGIYQKKYSNFGWYQVVGFGNSADFFAPILNATATLPNRDTEALVYLRPDAFGLTQQQKDSAYKFDIALGRLQVSSNTEWESFYSIKYNGNLSNDIVNTFNKLFKDEILKNNSDSSRQYFYDISDKSYRYSSRTSMIEATINSYQIISGVILIFVLGVALYVMGLITRKQIEKSRGQIGVLKALGYRKRQIVFNFVMTPLLTSVIGGVAGFLISQGVQVSLIRQFSWYFSMNFNTYKFDYIGFIVAVFLMWGVLTLIAFLIAFLILKDSALTLINANKTAKISLYGRFLKSMNFRKSFGSKMRTALLIDASGKMFGVLFVVLLSTFLMSVSYLAPSILSRYQIYAYNGINYEQAVEYAEPTANNPYTFLKTYNKNSTLNLHGDVSPVYDNVGKDSSTHKSKGYDYADGLQGITALPTLKNADGKWVYDTNEIVDAYLKNNISSEFNSLYIKTESDSPTGSEMSYANSKMLAAANISASNSFFRYMSSIAAPMDNSGLINGQIWSQLSDQWLEKGQFFNNINLELDSTNTDKWKRIFNLFQQFYIRYIDSIGLSISKFDNQENDSEEKRIEDFNSIDPGGPGLIIQKNAIDNLFVKDNDTSKKLINSLDQISNDDKPVIKFDDGKNGTKKYEIQNLVLNQDSNKQIDFINSSSSQFEDKELQQGIYAYSIWFGALFALRADQAIIQTGYSRAPYYVKQYMKAAFNDKDYYQGFNSINFDDKTDQLGTMLKGKINDKQIKIYGLDKQNKYMNLVNESGEDLTAKIVNSKKMENKNDVPEIVLNKTVASIFNIRVNQEIGIDLTQNMLYYDGKKVNIEDWKDSKQREDFNKSGLFTPALGVVPKSDGFIQTGNLNPRYAQFNDVKMYDGSPISIIGPPGLKTPLYDAYLNGKAEIINDKKVQKFKVVGINNNYGTPTAWISNYNANVIMGYDKVEDYLWANQFVQQWGDAFTKPENNKIYIPGYDPQKPWTLSEFKKRKEIADLLKMDNNYQNVLDLFKAMYPVFNYKYSKDKSIGDLTTTLSIWTKLGDYTPVTMNGNGKDKDGIAQGVFDLITPTEISKNILSQISNIILSILILLIVLILIITFVIILLTTSLIISDNARFIATMKVLGYTNKYIAKNVLGMYVIVILIAFALGLGLGWLGLWLLDRMFVVGIGIVLPITLTWWLIPAIFISIMGIYAITLRVGFKSITKLNAVHVLQNQGI